MIKIFRPFVITFPEYVYSKTDRHLRVYRSGTSPASSATSVTRYFHQLTGEIIKMRYTVKVLDSVEQLTQILSNGNVLVGRMTEGDAHSTNRLCGIDFCRPGRAHMWNEI